MTNRLMIGIDPGASGAIALLADEQPAGFIDMPIVPRETSGNEVNGKELAARLRGVMQQHSGAFVLAVMERVNAMPSIPGADGNRRSMGTQSAMNFGESYGIVKGVLAAVGISYSLVHPQTWKRRLALTGKEKDAARLLAIELFPDAEPDLRRKKDVGRADALCIAHWANLTEQLPRAA